MWTAVWIYRDRIWVGWILLDSSCSGRLHLVAWSPCSVPGASGRRTWWSWDFSVRASPPNLIPDWTHSFSTCWRTWSSLTLSTLSSSFIHYPSYLHLSFPLSLLFLFKVFTQSCMFCWCFGLLTLPLSPLEHKLSEAVRRGLGVPLGHIGAS